MVAVRVALTDAARDPRDFRRSHLSKVFKRGE